MTTQIDVKKSQNLTKAENFVKMSNWAQKINFHKMTKIINLNFRAQKLVILCFKKKILNFESF